MTPDVSSIVAATWVGTSTSNCSPWRGPAWIIRFAPSSRVIATTRTAGPRSWTMAVT